MNIILLSGGSGKRLWPLSNDVRSKQFIKIFRRPSSSVATNLQHEDEYESMVQRVYRQIKTVDPNAKVTIATGKSQISILHNQLGNQVEISVEPCRRDTFPAIALAAAFLHEKEGLSEEEAVVVCPVDPYVEDQYFECIQKMHDAVASGTEKLVLMGIEPTYPSEKYGYIIPLEDSENKYIFKEKPDSVLAEDYIKQKALWNGGVFAFKLKYILNKAEEIFGFSHYHELFEHYKTLPKISIDYAVVEREKELEVFRYQGNWKDLGTWNTLTEAMGEETLGDVRMDGTCKDVQVINELGIPILAMGINNAVICASPEGILVSDKKQSSYIKPFVDDIDQRVMFAEKSWGSFRVLDVGENSLTIRINLLPGHRLHYHSHERRDETWTVVHGKGMAVVDDKEIGMREGIILHLPAGCKHTVIAETEMTIIEVQIGKDISVLDKKKYSLEKQYGRHK